MARGRFTDVAGLICTPRDSQSSNPFAKLESTIRATAVLIIMEGLGKLSASLPGSRPAIRTQSALLSGLFQTSKLSESGVAM